MRIPFIPFHLMDVRRFPWRQHVDTVVRLRSVAKEPSQHFETRYDEQVAIRHHEMTINLALGREVSNGL